MKFSGTLIKIALRKIDHLPSAIHTGMLVGVRVYPRMVLGCLAGERNDQITARLHLQPVTVALWRKRFLAGEIAALSDLPRPGKPPTYNQG